MTASLPNRKSFMQLSLKEFVISSKASVRLCNCIVKASIAGNCPFSTVKDYMSNENSYQKILSIPNLGRKTALELDRLIKEAVKNSDIKLDFQHQTEKSISDNSDLIWRGKKLSLQALEQNIYDLIKSRAASTRINNLFDTFSNMRTFLVEL